MDNDSTKNIDVLKLFLYSPEEWELFSRMLPDAKDIDKAMEEKKRVGRPKTNESVTSWEDDRKTVAQYEKEKNETGISRKAFAEKIGITCKQLNKIIKKVKERERCKQAKESI